MPAGSPRLRWRCTLIIGILLGFPPIALGLLVGFSASTGPAFADMGYDLRAGYLLRGEGANPAFELAGRKQQLYAAMLAFLIAIPTVWFAHPGYFAQGLVPPVAKVYVATIQAGAGLPGSGWKACPLIEAGLEIRAVSGLRPALPRASGPAFPSGRPGEIAAATQTVKRYAWRVAAPLGGAFSFHTMR